jgi:hypothetical protein
MLFQILKRYNDKKDWDHTMKLMRLLSRKKVIKSIWHTFFCVNMLAILPPIALKELPASINLEEDSGTAPYWIKVLSKEIEYIPLKATPDIEQWKDVELQKKAYQMLDRAIEANLRVHASPSSPLSSDMNQIVIRYKTSQYLLEHTKGPYTFSKDFPPITFMQDPMRAKIFYDLALVILNHLIPDSQKSDATILSALETQLLMSAENYLWEGIKTIEGALRIAPDHFKPVLEESITKGKNYLKFTIKLLEQTHVSQAEPRTDFSLKLNIESLKRILPNLML